MSSEEKEDSPSIQKKEVLRITDDNKPIYLLEDWDQGIGGGLWSTGLALAKYLATDPARQQLARFPRILELGSGNGFLSACLLACCSDSLQRIVVTDTKEHLSLMERTLRANGHGDELERGTKLSVQEYLWGQETIKESFDLIVGSDLAYRDELHDPLIATLKHVSPRVTLLGVTMSDTKPIFFHKLVQAGFQYERLADHLLDPTFRGTTFGIFVIQTDDRVVDGAITNK